jgi:hypothetical protein
MTSEDLVVISSVACRGLFRHIRPDSPGRTGAVLDVNDWPSASTGAKAMR